jgi:transcriptional regulator of acetoin/glycerol metabolism
VVDPPSLREQLRDDPGELDNLVAAIVARLFDDDVRAELTVRVCGRMRSDLGDDYAWPGNFRELEQCIRNVVIRDRYHPEQRVEGDGDASFLESVAAGTLNADDLLAGYVERVYRSVGSYQAAARQLGLDRRTVKAKVEATRRVASS